MISCLLFLLPLVASQQNSYVSVTTSQGLVQGKTVNYGSDKNQLYYGKADVFLGIPYAEPPTGNNRFRAPRSAPQFNSMYDATYYRPKCPQQNAGGYVNEDCLYLNVFTQQTGNASAAMAVMVFIDGGNGLTQGGCDDTQLKGTVRNLVSRGVVVVTFQYRLGALGFFATQTTEFDSNLGMLDQVKVLQWVQTDISNFGGDPNRVTLCGQGDGGCAVSAHTLSPLSQNMFQQAIIQSGTINSCYSSDGTTANTVDQTPTTTLPPLQYDPGLQYQPLNQGGNQQTNNYNNQQFNGNTGYSNQQGSGSYNQGQQSSSNYNSNQQASSNQGTFSGFNANQGSTYSNQQTTNNQQYGSQQQSTNYNGQSGSGYNSANAQYDQTFVNPSQQLAQQLCNITAAQWRSGQIGNLRNCLSNYSVDFFVQTQGSKVATWMIVRDNNFLPDSIDNLAARRPPIPVIIGTVQDEDADYAFKLVANGQAGESEGDMFNDWMVDFARKNKVNASTQGQISNIISQNYNITPSTTSSTTSPILYDQGNQNNQNLYPYTGNNQNSQSSGYSNQNNGYVSQQSTYGQANQQQNFNNQNSGYSQNTGYSSQQQGITYNQQQQQGGYQQNTGYTNQNTQQNTGYSNQNTGYNQNSQQNTGYSNQNIGNANYGTAPQYDQSSSGSVSVANNPQAIQSLKTMSTVSSDAGIMSQTATEIDTFIQNGNQYVRVYQFTYVSDLGRQNLPNTGSWKPVVKGQDQVFLFMSETVWSQGNPTKQDRQVADQMGDRWTQFAKNGQVNNWQPSNTNDYSYCNLNQNPTIQTGYAQQARQVFNDQVNPIVTQAQQQSQPQQQQQQRPQQQYYPPSSPQQQQYPVYSGPSNPARVNYSQNGDSSTFQISFNLADYALPNNG